jgi:hypothetical protein
MLLALACGCGDRGVVVGDEGLAATVVTSGPSTASTGDVLTTHGEAPLEDSTDTSSSEPDASSTGSDGGEPCRADCDPFGSDCPRHEACLPWHPRCDPSAEACVPLGRDAEFRCLPDTSTADSIYGSPCEEHGACGRGHVCAPASAVPGCQGAPGCCTSLCPLGDPHRCPDASGGQACVPIHQDPARHCLEAVGVCLVP